MTDATRDRFNALFGEDTTRQRFDDLFGAPPPRVPLDAGIPKAKPGPISDAFGMGQPSSPFSGIETFEELRKKPGPSEMDVILQGKREERARAKEERGIQEQIGREASEDLTAMPQATAVNRLITGLGHGWDSALANMSAGRTDFWERTGGVSVEEMEQADLDRKEAEREMRLAPSGVGWFGAQVGQVAGSLYSSGKQGVKSGVVGAGAGGAVGGLPGAVSGFGAGLTGGFLADSYIVNSGSIAHDLSTFRGPNAETINEGEIDLYSHLGGSVMAVLDLAGMKVLSKPFEAPLRKLMLTEITDRIKTKLGETATRRGLTEYAKGLTAETVTETAQEVVQVVAEDIAKQERSGDLATVFNDEGKRKELIDRAVDTAISTAAGMSVVAAPGGIISAREQPDVPLTVTDRASPIPDDIIQAGKNDLADATAAEGMPEVAPQRPVEKPVAKPGKVGGQPVTDGKAVAAELFPDATLTSGYRGPDHPLSKKNPKSWHTKSHAAVDMAPIPGMTFEQARQRFVDNGYTIIEALNETGKGKTAHATGDHWHFVIGEGGAPQVATAPGIAPISPTAEAEVAPEAPVESTIESLKKATGIDVLAEEEVTEFKPGERIEVAQEGQPTKAGTVKEVYGEGERQGVVIEQDDGTTFDEEVARARSYGAKFRRPATDVVAAPVSTGRAEVSVPKAAEPIKTSERGVQTDLYGGPEVTAEEMDAKDAAPTIIKEATEADRLDDLADATDYVLRRSLEKNATAADRVQAVKELSQAVGRNLSTAEARALATEIERQQGKGQPEGEYTAFAEGSGTLGIPRDQMPQIKAEHRGALVNFLNAGGIEHQEETFAASSLKPTQAEFSPAKVRQAKEYKGGDRAILVSEEGNIVDGHHQWLAALENNEDIRAIVLKAPIRTVLDAAHAFPSSETVAEQSSKSAATEPEDTSAEPEADEEQEERRVEVKPTESGKGIEVHGASPELIAKIDAAVGAGKGAPRKDGAVVYSKKHGDKIREAVNEERNQQARARSEAARNKLVEANADKDFSKAGTPLPPEGGDRSTLLAQYKIDHNADEMRATLETYGVVMTPSQTVLRLEETPDGWTLFESKRSSDYAYGVGKGWTRAETIDKAVSYYFGTDPAFYLELADGGKHRHQKPFTLTIVEDPDGKFSYDSSINHANGGGSGPSRGTYYPADRYETMQAAKVAGLNAVWNHWRRLVDTERSDGAKKDATTFLKVQKIINQHLPTPRTLTDEDSKVDAQKEIDRLIESLAFNLNDNHDVSKLDPDVLNHDFMAGISRSGDGYTNGYYDAVSKDGARQAVNRRIAVFLTRFKEWPKLPEGLNRPVRRAEAEVAAPEEHPGLVIKSLETGKETTIQPPGTVAPKAASEAGIDAAREQGQQAFERGDKRVPPGFLFDAAHKQAWLAGWDSANIAAPIAEAVNPPSRPAGYGANNKLVSAERADEIRAKLRDKLRNQINSGIDPEMLALGTELAVFHIEAGARKFADFAKAVAADLGTKMADLKPFLRGWYLGAQAMIEDSGGDVDGMDGPGAVRAALAMLEDEPSNAPAVDDIGETDADAATETGIEEPDRAGDEGARAPDVSGVEGEGAVGEGLGRPGRAGAEQLRDGGVAGERGGIVGEPEPVAPGDGQRTDAGARPGRPRGTRPGRRVRGKPADRGANFVAPAKGLARTGSWRETAERNLDIIELVNKLDAEGRPATPDEQALLARFTGWGASEIRNRLFKDIDRKAMRIKQPASWQDWKETIERARELLQGPDLETALQSTQYAHYTSEAIVRSIWDALNRFGFHSGRILEPGMGIGHFFTAAPAEVMAESRYTGIELDAFTAKIARYLLPQENIIAGDFTRQAFPDGFFDAAIGNPPFANVKVLNDPAYKKARLSLHDYFFAKSLDKVRPGGLVAFVTSRYTLDKMDPAARKALHEKADLIGAIRLPQTAFKENAGTEVVTDVLFLQRRMPGSGPSAVNWTATKEVTVEGQKVAINQYFAEHPEMVLGKLTTKNTQYSRESLTVEPYSSKGSIEAQFAAAVEKLPQGVYTDQPHENIESIQTKTYDRDFAPSSTKEGGMYVKDGKVLIVDRGSGVPVEAIYDKVKASDHEWLKGYIGLRDLLKDAQKAQLQDHEDWETRLDKLVKSYRAFVKKHGRIKEYTSYERKETNDEGETIARVYRRFKWDRLLLDLEAPLVQSLERITDAGDVIDGPFLKGRTLNKPVRPVIETIDDALAVTLDEIGRLNIDYVAGLLGIDHAAAIEKLGPRIYRTPGGDWQTADEYLSGDVVVKLEEAETAAVTDPDMERNVDALRKVQPAPLSYENINVKLGAPWIRPETVSQFAAEVLEADNVPIRYETANAHWTVEGASDRWRRYRTTEFGTSDRSPLELLDAVLNNRSIKVTRKEDKKEVVDPAATEAANDAARKINERFKSWLWEDAARTQEYVETYNRSYNNLAPRRFDGSYLTTPGLSSHYTLYPHQKRAIARVIQTGNTYLNHAVGAGKTLEMIVSGMEMRRLGLIKKPMYIVPNHMLKQFSQEFLEAYPAANIMVADEQQFHTGNRQRFLAQASLNDPDAIILTHSSFGKVDTSQEMRDVVVGDMIADLEAAHEHAKAEGAARHTVSRIENQIEALKKRFEGRTGTGKDKLLTFDEMGVDFLFVDEGHEFRKLDFATNRNAKGIDSSGSARALDLFVKARWLHGNNPGRSMVMASGTPITNTMAELYTVMRFLALDEMEKDSIAAFDAWAAMFGEVVAGYEQNAAGGYEIVERFSKFVNVPELMKRARRFMDVLTSEQLGGLVQRPKVVGGLPIQDIAPASNELEAYMKGVLLPRLEESRKWKPTPDQPGNPDPVINIITDARLASIDLRFVTPGRKSDPNSKLNRMITRIAEVNNRTSDNEYLARNGEKSPRKGAAQIVFSAVGFGEQVATTRGFDVKGWIESELTRQGVVKSEIAWMSDANTHAKKEQLQKDVRSGKVRILFGSPKNMGTGLNVQDRLIALHYLSPPWYPADVEQPHGRIVRQGNQHEEVEIYWYATKGTYDSTQWGMVSRKQKFIEQAMVGDDSVRVLEDISEANKYEMAAALAAGDDRLIRVASLAGEITRLENLRDAHSRQQFELRSRARQLGERFLPKQRQKVADMEQAAKLVSYGPFQVTASGGNFDKHGEGGQALIDAMQKVIDNNVAIPRTEIGSFRGNKLFIAPSERFTGLQVELEVGPYTAEVGERFEAPSDWDAVGLARRIEGEFNRIPANLKEEQRILAEAEAEFTAAEKKVGAPFAEAGQLSEAIAERAQLQSEIAGEADKPKASVGDAGAEPIPAYLLRHDEALRVELLKQMKTFGIDDRIALRVGQNLELGEKTWQGQYWRRLISVATDIARNPSRVLAHETIHAMKALGLFTETEWKLLSDRAWANKERRAWVKQNYPDANPAIQREEAVAEEFADYFDMTRGQGKSFIDRMLVRAFKFVTALARAVGKLLNKPDLLQADVNSLMESIAKGKVGRRATEFGEPSRDRPGLVFEGFGGKRASVVGDIEPGEPDFGGNAEERWQQAKKGVGAPSIIDKAIADWEIIKASFSRHWKHLPNEPRFADVQQQLRKLEAAPDTAMDASVRHLKKMVGSMSGKEYDLFSRKVVLDDLSWDAGEGRELPFGFTPSTLVEARREIDAQVNLNPKLVKAVRERKTHNHAVADAMVTAGVLTRDQIKNPAYFRHMVLEYARAESALARTPGKVKSPYWAKRMGSTLDINANLLEAELDWLMKAQIDITTADTIEWIKASPLNVRENLRRTARTHNKSALAAELASNPSARKEDGWFRSNIARGFKIVQDEIEAGHLDPIPDHLKAAADALVSGDQDQPPFALLAWILDSGRPGGMGAGMVLKYAGQRKQWIRKLLGDDYHDPEDIAGLVRRYKPEGMVAWQPKEGRHLFTAKTVSEHVLDMFVGKLADTAAPGLDRAELAAALGSIRQQLVVGGDRYTMVIPEELGATLDEFGDRHAENIAVQLAAGAQSAWKRWVLINPRRFFKYNLNNMTGDLDAIIAGNPGTLSKVPEAWRVLRDASKGKVDPRYQDALDRGVFTSGLSAQEIPDINRFSEFRHLTEGKSLRPDKLTVSAIAKLWRILQDTTNFREALFRMAAYIDYVEKIESGKSQLKIGYGASVPNMVDAVTDPKDKAALLARDLVGDYGAISVAGGWLRRYLIPFWSWKEINTKRYWRLTANSFRVSKARGLATGGLLGAGVAARTALGLYIRMGVVFAALWMWNHMLFPDEEDDLGDIQKKQLHLILGRDDDGNVITLRTQGALSDVLSTLGFTDLWSGLDKWQDGQGTIGGAFLDMAKAPANVVLTGGTPLVTAPLQLAQGRQWWPDFFNNRPIHDSGRFVASIFSVENEYDHATDKPSRGYARSWTESLVYRRNPDEMAYDEAKGIAYDWLERVKGQEGGGFTSARGEALRDYRLGLRYGDQSAADKALIRYAELGGTEKSLKQSIAKQHPLGPIAKKDRAEFLDSLTDEQLDTFAKAEDYWERIYAGGE